LNLIGGVMVMVVRFQCCR